MENKKKTAGAFNEVNTSTTRILQETVEVAKMKEE